MKTMNARPHRGFGPFLRKNTTLVLGTAVLLLLVIISILAPLLWTQDPLAINHAVRLQGPSPEHWLGTDLHGRDL